jgi:hypothetical protein
MTWKIAERRPRLNRDGAIYRDDDDRRVWVPRTGTSKDGRCAEFMTNDEINAGLASGRLRLEKTE